MEFAEIGAEMPLFVTIKFEPRDKSDQTKLTKSLLCYNIIYIRKETKHTHSRSGAT